MDSWGPVVVGMRAIMILIGVTVLRLSRRDCLMGATGVAPGTLALTACFAGDGGTARTTVDAAGCRPTTPDVPVSPTLGP